MKKHKSIRERVREKRREENKQKIRFKAQSKYRLRCRTTYGRHIDVKRTPKSRI